MTQKENLFQLNSLQDIHRLITRIINSHSNNINITEEINNNILLQIKDISINEQFEFNLKPSECYSDSFHIHNKTSLTPCNQNDYKLTKININTTRNDYIMISFISPSCLLINYVLISFLLLVSLFLFYFKLLNCPHYFTSSNIATKEDFKLISSWINQNFLFNYTLIYRANRDGDSAEEFHNHCDKQGKTLTLVLTQNGWKFGDYADAEWDSLKIYDERYNFPYKNVKTRLYSV